MNFFDPEICNSAQKRVIKPEIPKSEDELVLEKINSGVKITESGYQSIDQVKIGDIVKYTSTFGEPIFGIIIEKKGSSKLRIKSYAGAKTPVFAEESFKKVTKVEITN